jgi:nucleotide-binding universal stress UspA family protein
MKKRSLKRKLPPKQTAAKQKRQAAQTAARIILNHILVPIDFSDNSKKALRYALPLAEKFNAGITVIYVVEPAVFPSDFGFGQMSFPDVEKEMYEKAEAELRQIVADLNTKVKVKPVIKSGIPFVEVTTFASDEQADLIIIATHGRTGVEHILFGSTAEKIIRKAPCPVLVVRAEEHDFIDDRV